MLEAKTAVCTIFGKSSRLHVELLQATPDENLKIIEETVAYLKSHGRRVFYDAEHFFDAYREDASYSLETLRSAVRGGAEILVLCDTNGGSLPWDVEDAVRAVAREITCPLGIHAHDDSGCAAANSLAAVKAGAVQVQGTFNGYGERCGNANLCSIMPTLELKLGYACLPHGRLRELYEVSHLVAEIANISPNDHQAYVGRSAFAHKGGVHVAAMRRCASSYQHVAPEAVGNVSRVVVSELSGRANLRSKAEEMGLALTQGAEGEVLSQIKEAEARGYSYEAAEASVALMLRRKHPDYQAPFRLLDYKVLIGQREQEVPFAEATIKIAVADQVLHTAGEGSGPVGALDAALRKALLPAYPAVARIHLTDYKVRILDGTAGTAAITRVLLDSCNDHGQWSTVGASPNIIEASWHALADSIEYGLTFSTGATTP